MTDAAAAAIATDQDTVHTTHDDATGNTPDDVPTAAAATDENEVIRVRLGDLDIAPENIRAKEPADDGIPTLAETVASAGVIVDLLVRPGRGKEKPWMVLDGRRRLLALQLLLSQARVTDDYQVNCSVKRSKEAQTAAVMLPNTERAPVHIADVIAGIGKLQKAKFDYTQIAAALGYQPEEIRKLAKLSSLPAEAIKALREGRLSQRGARLIARLPSKEEQRAFAKEALQGINVEYQLQSRLASVRLTGGEAVFALVGAERYREAGGRVESDLFGELPEAYIDGDKFHELWRERVQPVIDALKSDGLSVFVARERAYSAPDGFERDYFIRDTSMKGDAEAAWKAAQQEVTTTRQAVRQIDLTSDEAIATVVNLAAVETILARAAFPKRTIGAVVVSPSKEFGIELSYFFAPKTEAELAAEQEDEEEEGAAGSSGATISRSSSEVEVPRADVETEGVNHSLHETYTDVATRALIRAVSDDPSTALTALVAHLFAELVLTTHRQTSESALTITAKAYSRPGHGAIATLDGEVRARLDERRQAYKASGLRPILWVAELPHGEKMSLLAELVALSLDMREVRTSLIRHGARADAVEISELCGLDVTSYWTPDEAFLKVHPKKRLLTILEQMEAVDDRAKSMKKDDLVAFVGEQAAERSWAPGVLNWPANGATGDLDADEPDKPETPGGLEGQPGEEGPLSEAGDDDSGIPAAANSDEPSPSNVAA